MLGTDLSYVRKQLKKLGPSQRRAVSGAVRVHVKTLNRLASRETKYGRTDTVGKLAAYFRAVQSKEP